MFDNIKKLCEIDGISGRESLVAKEILQQVKPIADDAFIDKIGNVIAFKKGRRVPKNKIMLSAHTDEIGMIVTGIKDDGMLRVATVGGVDSRVILGRGVYIYEKGVYGVIGTKAVHMQTAEERKTAVEVDKLYVDIGASTREEAEKYASLGDSISFVGDYEEFGDGCIKAKAIDDRAGCAILIEIMKQDLEFDTYFAFSVQEEVGLRGAKVASFTVEPDVAVVVETTASGDVAGVKGADRVSVVGDGAVISYMDTSTIYDKGLFDLAFKLAKEQNIKVQTKTKISGGNDAGAIHVSQNGVRTVAVSIPSKYIHSPASVVKKDDVMAVYQMALALTNAVGEV